MVIDYKDWFTLLIGVTYHGFTRKTHPGSAHHGRFDHLNAGPGWRFDTLLKREYVDAALPGAWRVAYLGGLGDGPGATPSASLKDPMTMTCLLQRLP